MGWPARISPPCSTTAMTPALRTTWTLAAPREPVEGAGSSRAALEPQAESWTAVEPFDQGLPRPRDRPAGAVPAGASSP